MDFPVLPPPILQAPTFHNPDERLHVCGRCLQPIASSSRRRSATSGAVPL